MAGFLGKTGEEGGGVGGDPVRAGQNMRQEGRRQIGAMCPAWPRLRRIGVEEEPDRWAPGATCRGEEAAKRRKRIGPG
ncbi:hypothetical protein E2562_005269 [Oryza meyeriana var. granulata]|uniref:Uncharacterized protein n=1 Tax=Oryza meyeriana var. granulata TaxID=110450 RepID=A0A6G1EEU7_9ORYZ|nr:hypothetical protein E2562_005269 [Oryza meyeriana var. granulata]